MSAIQQKSDLVDAKIKKQLTDIYPTSRVYVTFETEEHQRDCLNALEVPDVNAFLDIDDASRKSLRFKGKNVLNVNEAPEPDNILYENLELGAYQRVLYSMVEVGLGLSVLVACFFFISYLLAISALLAAVVISMIDVILPAIFQFLTDFSAPEREDSR